MYFGSIGQDIAYAIRTLRKNPAFTATALAALAIGIGANTAIFSVIDAVLLKPLSYPASDRIVLFYVTSPVGPSYGASATKFNAWRQSATFDDVAAYEYRGAELNLTGGLVPEQVHAIRVSAAYFPLLGARMALGRAFTGDEDRPGSGGFAVISHGLWQRRYAGDPRIVGQTILLGGTPHTIVGVMDRNFNTELDSPPDVWLPFQIDGESTDHAQYFNVIGRLKPNVSLAAANAQLAGPSAAFHARFPNIVGPRDQFAVRLFEDALVSDARSSLLILAAAVSLVLLIACANVANLLLVRATGRAHEIAIRAAVGAARVRLIQQLLIESLVLSAAGGALGFAIGLFGVRALLAANPADLPRIGGDRAVIALDWRLAAFTTALALLTGILFGLAPALDISRADLAAALKQGGRSGAGRHQNKTRSLLVIGEVALAVVLLMGATLLIRTFLALRSVDPGFDSHRVLTMRMSLAGSRFRSTNEVDQLLRDGIQHVEALPGIARAAASYTLPLEGTFGVPFHIVGRAPDGGRYDGRGWLGISPGYFDVFQIPVTRGRAFVERDGRGSPLVAIVNQAMVRRFWPQSDRLGGRVLVGHGYSPEFEEPERQIVGVAADVHDSGLNQDPAPLVYVPLSQVPDGITAVAIRAASIAWAIRTRGEPAAFALPVQNALLQVSGLPATGARSMEEVVRGSTARADFDMLLLTTFGTCALLLAAIGIYGVMAYSVRQRTREFGIRVALGAETGRVRSMILLQGMRLAAMGIALGLAASLMLTRLMAGFLFHVKAWDPVALVLVPILLAMVSGIAVWLPAARATRVDPVSALRTE